MLEREAGALGVEITPNKDAHRATLKRHVPQKKKKEKKYISTTTKILLSQRASAL